MCRCNLKNYIYVILVSLLLEIKAEEEPVTAVSLTTLRSLTLDSISAFLYQELPCSSSRSGTRICEPETERFCEFCSFF